MDGKKAFSGVKPALSESKFGQEKYVEDSQHFLIFKLKGLKDSFQNVCQDCLFLSDNLYADRVISIEERVEYICQVFTRILTFVPLMTRINARFSRNSLTRPRPCCRCTSVGGILKNKSTGSPWALDTELWPFLQHTLLAPNLLLSRALCLLTKGLL